MIGARSITNEDIDKDLASAFHDHLMRMGVRLRGSDVRSRFMKIPARLGELPPHPICHLMHANAGLQIGENKWPLSTHFPRIPLHDFE